MTYIFLIIPFNPQTNKIMQQLVIRPYTPVQGSFKHVYTFTSLLVAFHGWDIDLISLCIKEIPLNILIRLPFTREIFYSNMDRNWAESFKI